MGSADEFFYSLNAFTGETNWKFKAAGKVGHSAIIFDNMVFFGCFKGVEDGFIYALDFQGNEIWKFKTESSVVSNLSIHNGKIFIIEGKKIYALDVYNGHETWCMKINETIYNDVAVHGENVFISYSDYVSSKGGLSAINSATGDVIWKFSTENNIQSSPAISNTNIYIGGQGIIYALDIVTGNEKFRLGEKDKNNYQNYKDYKFTISKNEICFTNRKDLFIFLFDLNTASIKWKVQTDAKMTSAHVLIDNTLYGCENHKFYALDLNTGEEQWNFKVNDRIFSTPAIANGLAYFGSEDGYLYAIE